MLLKCLLTLCNPSLTNGSGLWPKHQFSSVLLLVFDPGENHSAPPPSIHTHTHMHLLSGCPIPPPSPFYLNSLKFLKHETKKPSIVHRRRAGPVFVSIPEMKRSTVLPGVGLFLLFSLAGVGHSCVDPESAYRFTGIVCRLMYPAAVVCEFNFFPPC